MLTLSVTRRGKVTARTLAAEQLGDLERVQRADGSGDLVFRGITAGPAVVPQRGRAQADWNGFQAVRQVKQVEEIVRAVVVARAGSSRGRAG